MSLACTGLHSTLACTCLHTTLDNPSLCYIFIYPRFPEGRLSLWTALPRSTESLRALQATLQQPWVPARRRCLFNATWQGRLYPL